MEYVKIPQTCPECGRGLPCHVEAQPGFAYCEPDYAVPCRHCGKTVRLELPGPPIDITPPRRPKFPRWPMQGLQWLGKEVLRAGLREAIRQILDALFRRRAARAGVG